MKRSTLRLDDFLPYRLSFTSNLVSEAVAQTYMALFGLRIPEWRVIAVAAERDGITQQEICRVTMMDKMTVSRAADALTGRGLLVRSANPDDRRSHLLALSDAGRALYTDVAPKALELEREIFACLGDAEHAAFDATLRRIDAALLAKRQG